MKITMKKKENISPLWLYSARSEGIPACVWSFGQAFPTAQGKA
jgi:hypothetical protein